MNFKEFVAAQNPAVQNMQANIGEPAKYLELITKHSLKAAGAKLPTPIQPVQPVAPQPGVQQ